MTMKAVKRYFYNAMLMTGAALFMRAVSVAFNVYVTGKLGADGMGLLTLVSSAYGFAVTFATSGVSLAVTRMTAETVLTSPPSKARTRLGYVMKTSVRYCLFFGITGGAALFFGADYIGGVLLGDARTIGCLRLFAVTLPFTSLASAFAGYFNACRRVYKNAVSDFCGQVFKITLTASLLAVFMPSGTESMLLAVVCGGAVAEASSFAVSLILYLQDRRSHFSKPDVCSDAAGTELSAETPAAAARSLRGAALPVAFSSYLRSGLVTVEHILIPKALRRSGAGYKESLASYGTLHGMVMPVIMFPYAVIGPFSSLLVPELSESRARGQDARIRHIVSVVYRATLIFAVGVSGLMITFSGELGHLLYNSAEAGRYIRMIAPVIPVMYLDTATDSMLKGLGEQLFCMRVNIIDSALSVMLVWLLVPRLGISGYAATIIISEIFNASLSIWRLLTVTGVRPKIFGWLLRPLLASMLASSATRFIINFIPRLYRAGGVMPTVLMMTAASALYLMLLFVTDTLTVSDAEYMKRVLSG